MFANTLTKTATQLRRAAKATGGLCLVSLVAACGGSIETAPIENPNFFYGKLDRSSGVMTGLYNPAAYSESQVRSLLAKTCGSNRLASYSQSAQSNLIAYANTCRGGTSPRYSYVSFEKQTAKTVLLEATGSDGNGNVLFTQLAVDLGPRGATTRPLPAATPATSASDASAEVAATAPQANKTSDPSVTRCRNSITIHCKDIVTGGVIPNPKPTTD